MPRSLTLVVSLLVFTLVACRNIPAPQESVDQLKLFIRDTGLYRVELSDLQDAGFSLTSLDTQTARLTEKGEDVPFFTDEGGLVFYGRASTDRYTAERVYILSAGQQGLEMDAQPAGASPAAAEPLTTIQRNIHLERNLEYVSEAAAASGPSGPWFWQTIGFEEHDPIQFSIQNPSTGSGQLHLRLYGVSYNATVDPDHHLSLVLNGQQIGQVSWDGQTPYTATVALAPGSLVSGSNSLAVRGDAQGFLDISKLDWIEIDYDSAPRTEDDYLAFRSEPGAVTLGGFDEQPVLLDISEPASPTLLTDWTFNAGSAHVAFDQGGFIVGAAGDGFLQPSRMAPLRTSALSNRQLQADLLIVTTEALAAELAPLVEARQEQGLSVVIALAEDIYDTFGHGAETPESIKQFVSFAHRQWQPPAPRYLLLVGDATTDYWGFLSEQSEEAAVRPENFIPSYLVPVSFGGETVSDARLADVEGDVRPELAVGRWPVTSVLEVREMVQRTLSYEESAAGANTVFAIDDSSAEFQRLADHLVSASGLSPEKSQLLSGPTTDELAASWNESTWLVSYVGHGSLQLWGKDGILSTDEVDTFFESGASPIVVQLTCLTALFAHPEITSLSEVMLAHEGGPAIVIGATSLTLSTHQQPFAAELLEALRRADIERIGDALQIAKSTLNVDNVGLREISDTFVLLGDPSAPIVRP